MNVWIYNPNSSGGSYEYGKQLHLAYKKSALINCHLLLSGNSNSDIEAGKILIKDRPPFEVRIISQLWFILRATINPLILFWYLSKHERTGIVIFNEFDQLTAPVWVPMFRMLKKKFIFIVVLHDPDRSGYPPSKLYSDYCMKRMMDIMDIAFFHEALPSLPYYENYAGIRMSVPHGLYTYDITDEDYLSLVNEWKGTYTLLGVLGNIREEKNYEYVIKALTFLPTAKLIVAGDPSNTSVRIERYRLLAEKLQVNDRILWCLEYLNDAKLNSVIQAVDIPVLYYRDSFTSQSGIFNALASFRKNIIISITNSALYRTASRHGIGTCVEPDNLDALVEGIKTAMINDDFQSEWDAYLQNSGWDLHRLILEDIIKAKTGK